jgi:hypothetical protein
MKFLLNVTDISETLAEQRIKDVIAKGKDATVLYKLKDNTRKLNTNMHRYSAEQLAYVKEHMKEIIHYFGYASLPEV